MPQLLYPDKELPVPIKQRLAVHQSWSGHFWEYLLPLPDIKLSKDLSLYQLSYRNSPHFWTWQNLWTANLNRVLSYITNSQGILPWKLTKIILTYLGTDLYSVLKNAIFTMIKPLKFLVLKTLCSRPEQIFVSHTFLSPVDNFRTAYPQNFQNHKLKNFFSRSHMILHSINVPLVSWWQTTNWHIK